MKLIKINQDHYVIVDDSEIKEGDWYYQHNPYGSVIDKCDDKSPFVAKSARYIWENKGKRITHSTKPESFGDGWMQSIKPLLLSEVKELLGEVDVDKKTEEFAKHHSIYDSAQDDTEYGYREGYNQCLEDNKEKKYTEHDLIKAMTLISKFSLKTPDLCYTDKYGDMEYKIISLLQPKTEWEVEFNENGKLKLI